MHQHEAFSFSPKDAYFSLLDAGIAHPSAALFGSFLTITFVVPLAVMCVYFLQAQIDFQNKKIEKFTSEFESLKKNYAEKTAQSDSRIDILEQTYFSQLNNLLQKHLKPGLEKILALQPAIDDLKNNMSTEKMTRVNSLNNIYMYLHIWANTIFPQLYNRIKKLETYITAPKEEKKDAAIGKSAQFAIDIAFSQENSCTNNNTALTPLANLMAQTLVDNAQ